MGSSGGGPGNPAFLSQGGRPIPGLPIAGQGAPNDNPQNYGKFQEFLPTIQPPGGTAGGYTIPSNAETRSAPSATGLKSEMFQYRSPSGAVAPSDVDSLRQQLASLQSQVGGGAGGGDGNGQFGAARGSSSGGGLMPMGQFGQMSPTAFPVNWLNSNNPNVTS